MSNEIGLPYPLTLSELTNPPEGIVIDGIQAVANGHTTLEIYDALTSVEICNGTYSLATFGPVSLDAGAITTDGAGVITGSHWSLGADGTLGLGDGTAEVSLNVFTSDTGNIILTNVNGDGFVMGFPANGFSQVAFSVVNTSTGGSSTCAMFLQNDLGDPPIGTMTIQVDRLNLNTIPIFKNGNQPATSTSTGKQGQVAFATVSGTTYFYYCSGTNVWKRVALGTF